MILKRSFTFGFVLASLFTSSAFAERRSALLLEASSSGKLLRVSIGASSGLAPNGPVLITSADRKLVSGRVVRLNESTAVIAVLERYGSEAPQVEKSYELVYGEPFPEAANLTDYVVDREAERDNPANETFLQKSPEELAPELDDDRYTPEITLRPKLPEPRTYSPHNVTLGIALFRNAALPTDAEPNLDQLGQGTYTWYQGYVLRYAYTFRANYWVGVRMPATVSVEAMMGIYNFDHTFPTSDSLSAPFTAHVRVFTPGVNLRYMVEVNSLFRLYPYIGYSYNLASSAAGTLSELNRIRGGRLLGGAGAQLVLSKGMDARFEGGSDGVMGGLVVKF